MCDIRSAAERDGLQAAARLGVRACGWRVADWRTEKGAGKGARGRCVLVQTHGTQDLACRGRSLEAAEAALHKMVLQRALDEVKDQAVRSSVEDYGLTAEEATKSRAFIEDLAQQCNVAVNESARGA